MKLVMIYYECIVKQVERECQRLRRKLESRKLSDLLFRSMYKENLTMYENMLCEMYSELSVVLEEDERFNNELADLINGIKSKLSL